MRRAGQPRFRKKGLYSRPRGTRLPRKQKFQAELATDSGVKVRSKYEKTCADFLHASGIEFQFEPLMLLKGRQFRPDFYLPEYNLFLEICGYGHMPYYRSRMRHKQRLYDELGLRSAFIHYDGKGSLEELIRCELKKWTKL